MMTQIVIKELAPSRGSGQSFGPDQSIWLLGLEDIEQNTGRIIEKKRVPAGIAGGSTYAFSERNVLYSKLRPNLNKVVCPTEPGLATTELVPLCPDPYRLHREYLAYYLRSPNFVAWASNAVSGAKMPRVQMTEFWQQTIPIPYADNPKKSLAEQRRIAAILDQADGIRKKRRQAIDELNNLIPAIFYDMFGSPINSKKWKKGKIASIANIIVPTRDKPKSFTGTIPWITLPDANNDSIYISSSNYNLKRQEAEEVGNRLMPKGAVILSCAGSMGIVKIATKELYTNQQFYGLIPKPEQVTSEYLAYCLLLRSPEFYKNLSGTVTISFFSKAKALDILVSIPEIKMQNEFSRKVQAIHQHMNKQYNSLNIANDVFSCLVQCAFKGGL